MGLPLTVGLADSSEMIQGNLGEQECVPMNVQIVLLDTEDDS